MMIDEDGDCEEEFDESVKCVVSDFDPLNCFGSDLGVECC